MSMTMLSIFQMIQALAVYSFVMLLLPFLVLSDRFRKFRISEQVIGYFLAGNFYTIYLVFLLQFLHISNSVTLWVGTLFPIFVVIWKKKGLHKEKQLAEHFFRLFLHILKGEIGIKTLLLSGVCKLNAQYRRKIERKLWQWLPDIVLMAVIIAGVFYIYGTNTATVFGYKASDVPVHNLWINNMSENQIFSKGVYPYGFHCMIYYLHTVFGIKTYILLRVFSVVQTLFIHLALLISLKVICKNRFAPYIGTGAYLFLGIYSDSSYMRFASTLPQEYGMLFIFPAAVMAIRFFQEYKKTEKTKEEPYRFYLLGFTISFSLTLTVHFYNTIPAGVLCVGIAFGFITLFVRWRYFWRIMLAGIVSIVIAVLPMAVGVATGHKLEGSLYWAMGVMKGEEKENDQSNQEKVTKIVDKNGNIVTVVGDIDEETLLKIVNGDQEEETADSSDDNFQITDIETPKEQQENEKSQQNDQLSKISKIRQILEVLKSKGMIILGQIQTYCAKGSHTTALVMVISIVGLVVAGIVAFFLKQIAYASVLVSIGFYMLFMCIMQSLLALGLPEIMQGSRLSIFYCYSMGIVWGLVADIGIGIVSKLLDFILKKRWIRSAVQVVILLSCIIWAVVGGVIRTPIICSALETNEAIICLANIIHENKDLNWTILSANDERQMIYGFGWHYEMITFLREQKDLVKNPIITIPTEYVYFFIEKQPINYAGTAGLDVTLPRVSEEGASEPVSMLSGIYPYSGEERWGTMSHMYYWAQAFQRLYPEEMEVYYETEDFVCYRLHQNVNSLYNLAIDYGYNDPKEQETDQSDVDSEVSQKSDSDAKQEMDQTVRARTDSEEEMDGFAQELRSYYDYYGNRLLFISTFEHGKGEMEQLPDE